MILSDHFETAPFFVEHSGFEPRLAHCIRSVSFAIVAHGTAVPCALLLSRLPIRFRLRRTVHWTDAHLRPPNCHRQWL